MSPPVPTPLPGERCRGRDDLRTPPGTTFPARSAHRPVDVRIQDWREVHEDFDRGTVTIKNVEVSIIDRAWEEGWVKPLPPAHRTDKKVAVVGSGPAGLAAAQQLTRAGHDITVYERADRIGGLLRYGIPEFKMEKRHIDRRLAQMKAEGTTFRTGVNIGVDITVERLRADNDAIVLTGGATRWRDLPAKGRELDGIHQAMEYLPLANKVQEGDLDRAPLHAQGKHVVVIGGGDTGADCVGTARRQGAESVTQLEIMSKPPAKRPDHQPWTTMPMLYKVTSSHEECGERIYSVNTVAFLGDENGHVRARRPTPRVDGGSLEPPSTI